MNDFALNVTDMTACGILHNSRALRLREAILIRLAPSLDSGIFLLPLSVSVVNLFCESWRVTPTRFAILNT